MICVKLMSSDCQLRELRDVLEARVGDIGPAQVQPLSDWRLPRRNATAASVMNSAANRFSSSSCSSAFQSLRRLVGHVGQRQVEALQALEAGDALDVGVGRPRARERDFDDPFALGSRTTWPPCLSMSAASAASGSSAADRAKALCHRYWWLSPSGLLSRWHSPLLSRWHSPSGLSRKEAQSRIPTVAVIVFIPHPRRRAESRDTE